MPLSAASAALDLPDAQATQALGTALARALFAQRDAVAQRGFALGLDGDLGAGKTTLVRALLRAAGVTGSVKSPSYALLEPYDAGGFAFYHFDFYRFKQPREFVEGGFSEYFGAGGICLVEWPDQAGEYLPPLDLRVQIQTAASAESDGRSALLLSLTPLAQEIADSCRKGLAEKP